MSINERVFAAFCCGIVAGAAIMDFLEYLLKVYKP
jgi:hypothetical protein